MNCPHDDLDTARGLLFGSVTGLVGLGLMMLAWWLS
jgi:hypothetical protein